MKAIFIEAGHGKSLFGTYDSGAVGRFGNSIFVERDLAKQIARRVLAILKSKDELKDVLIQGVGVETDANIISKMKFVNSVIIENQFKPNECFGIAIHMNAGGNATGFETWFQMDGKSRPLCEQLCRSWLDYKITPLRPKALNNSKDGRYKRFYIDDARCAYAIVETSFISNLSDCVAITNNYDRVAEAIAHGLMQYILLN